MKNETSVGKKYNKLTVLEIVGKNKWGNKMVKVQCDCDKKTIFNVILGDIKSGNTTSCGCNRKGNNKKYNNYDLTNEYGIGYDYKGKEFYFDLEDYDKIKDVCWHVENDNGVVGVHENKLTLIHKIITNTSKEIIVDHININPSDNRKENLRIVTKSQNSMNKKGHGKMSKFGLKGIVWHKKQKKWCGNLIKDYKYVYRNRFDSIEEAIKFQIEAEKTHFGKYRYAWENDIKWEELLEYEKELKGDINEII